jgi:hypothetical protein
LSKYVGWGGLPEAFDEFNKSMDEKGKLRNDLVQKQSNITINKKR